ncbi:MAG: metal ABC transporter substrate-binding protein [Oligoflexus sp.]|jgi:zinc/manganese transport system substrate-binding protein
MISKMDVYFSFLLLILNLGASPLLQAQSKPLVLSTIPDFAWMIQEITGDTVDSQSLLKGQEDPHFVDALPDFIRRVADAKIVCIVGLDLEIGYMPSVLSRSGNASVQGSGPGVCDISKAITVLEKPTGPIDRSMGDVHAAGNPHYFLSPLKLVEGGREVVRVLTRNFPEHQALYNQRYRSFADKMQKLHKSVYDKLAPLRKAQGESGILIEYHREFVYFLEAYDLKSYGSIEEKPGVPPSAGRLAELSKQAKPAGVKLILAAEYNPQRTLKRFADLSGLPLAIVPTMIQAGGGAQSYEEHQNRIADSMLKAINTSP